MPDDLMVYEDAIEQTAKEDRRLLLGNGFSIAQAGARFCYGNLLERSGLANEGPIRNVFRAFDTVDFEEVMHALEHASKIEKAYGNDRQADIFKDDAAAVREALISAVRAVHPSIQFDVPEQQRTSCAEFLSNFPEIFTLNYDLLLYWVILNSRPIIHCDGFGWTCFEKVESTN